MVIVVMIAGAMLINTVGRTVQLSSGASEDPEAELDDASPVPSEAASEAQDDNGEEADGEFPQTYTVEDGDTGAEISERFYGNPDGWQTIAEANDIDPSAPLRVGVELEIPPPPE
jgi:nucleoid-associated protein YgaU